MGGGNQSLSRGAGFNNFNGFSRAELGM